MGMLEDIRYQIDKFGNVQNLMKYFSVDLLVYKHNVLISKEIKHLNKSIRKNRDNNENLLNKRLNEINLSLDDICSLYEDILAHNYFPSYTRRTYIQKWNNKLRPLDIPAYRDKLVQSIFVDILDCIYEPEFNNTSFAYRRKIGCHTAIEKINETVKEKDINSIVKIDIKSFFNNIDHQKLLEILKYTIKDKYFLMYIERFLNVGILDKDIIHNTDIGVHQGFLIAPILSNIYLHYVIDEWFESHIKEQFNNCELIRYADDLIICSNTLTDSKLLLSLVQSRLLDYNLEIEPDKSKIIPFYDIHNNFNFLGFSITKSTRNSLSIKISPSKMKQKCQYIYQIIHDNINLSFICLVHRLNEILLGYYNYYYYSSNAVSLSEIYRYTAKTLLQALISSDKLDNTYDYELYMSTILFFLLKPPTPDELFQL